MTDDNATMRELAGPGVTYEKEPSTKRELTFEADEHEHADGEACDECMPMNVGIVVKPLRPEDERLAKALTSAINWAINNEGSLAEAFHALVDAATSVGAGVVDTIMNGQGIEHEPDCPCSI